MYVWMISLVMLGLSLPAGNDQQGWSLSRVARVHGGFLDGVRVEDLDVEITEVSFAQIGACVEAGQCLVARTLPTDQRRANHPVSGVTHSEAAGYCRAIEKRLPTEAEWEWVARSGSMEGGNPWTDADEVCRFAALRDPVEGVGCGYFSTWPVASLSRGATAQGVLHMAGNVSEWTSTGEGNGVYVVRGGSYSTSPAEGGIFERSLINEAGGLGSYVGFRCVSGVAGS